MQTITTIGLDIAKSVFQVHGDQDNPLVPKHCRMRAFGRDLIRGGHYGHGHVNRTYRPNTWLHRPMLQNVKKALANPEPSTHGRYCCKSRKSNNTENLAKADFQTPLPRQRAVAPMRRSVVVFVRNNEVPHIATYETHQRS
jgi:hypothetical protein